jgi:hypothetical protein
VSSPVGYRWFRHAGGVNPCLPPTVSGRYLSFSEREDIALFRAQSHGVREIARRVRRVAGSPSTISRELRRNASTRTWRLDYKATIAQWHAEPRACRPKLAESERLRTWVQDRLAGEVKLPDGTTVGPKPKAWNGKNAQSCVRLRRCAPAARRPGTGAARRTHGVRRSRPQGGCCALCRLIAVGGPHFAHPLHRRQLAKRVQLVEGAMAALDHPWNDIVAPETDGPLELQEDLCRCEHRRPLPAD